MVGRVTSTAGVCGRTAIPSIVLHKVQGTLDAWDVC